MEDQDAELLLELEALEITYGDLLRVTGKSGPSCRVTVHIEPCVSEDELFVEGWLEMLLPPQYPSKPPQLQLLDHKGLGDARAHELLSLLHKEAADQAADGALMLGHLVETARAYMSEHNEPEGACAFCLCPMGKGVEHGTHGLLRLPCFHAFHRPCFVEWWAWHQRSLSQREQELIKHTGAAAAAEVVSQKLPPKEEGGWFFQTSCPVCRAPAPMAQLTHIRRDLVAAARQLRASANKQPQPGADGGGSGDGSSGQDGPQQAGAGAPGSAAQQAGTEGEAAVDLEAVRQLQQRHKALFSKQADAGGIIGVAGKAAPEDAGARGAAGGEGSGATAPQGTGAPSTSMQGSKGSYHDGRRQHHGPRPQSGAAGARGRGRGQHPAAHAPMDATSAASGEAAASAAAALGSRGHHQQQHRHHQRQPGQQQQQPQQQLGQPRQEKPQQQNQRQLQPGRGSAQEQQSQGCGSGPLQQQPQQQRHQHHQHGKQQQLQGTQRQQRNGPAPANSAPCQQGTGTSAALPRGETVAQNTNGDAGQGPNQQRQQQHPQQQSGGKPRQPRHRSGRPAESNATGGAPSRSAASAPQ